MYWTKKLTLEHVFFSCRNFLWCRNMKQCSWNNRLTVTKSRIYLGEEFTVSLIVCANSEILWPHCWKEGRWKTDIRNTKQPDVGRGNYLHKMQRAILQKKRPFMGINNWIKSFLKSLLTTFSSTTYLLLSHNEYFVKTQHMNKNASLEKILSHYRTFD